MKNQKRRLECLAAYTVLLFFIIFVGFPFIWMIATSFKYDEDILAGGLSILPLKITFQHYINVFVHGNLGTYFKNSVIVAGFTVILSFIAVIPAAYALSILKTKTSHILSRTILLFQMMPGVLLLIPLYIT
ncbi:MAG: carbohydrate ABC transporter permease, partial [Firmicutes bacterium]|nr:carbohydrate ABC transporter permease [Bacillota bacterium]